MTPDGLPTLREVISGLDLAARKSLGQNFLLDLNLTRRIARAAAFGRDETVIEIGPGPGGLTRALFLEGAPRVIAIEKDPRVRPALDAIGAHYPDRLTLIEADALEFDEPKLLKAHERAAVIANLPYNVGSALLVKWLTLERWPPWWSALTLMFQREVAHRLVAAPATPDYGRLSVLTQWRAEPQLLFDIPPQAFVPQPKVTSTVVRLTPRQEPLSPASLTNLARVTAAAFGQRRKMLRVSLKQVSSAPETMLLRAGIDPALRGETLSVEQFCAIARAL